MFKKTIARVVKTSHEDFWDNFIVECQRQLIITDTFTKEMFFNIYQRDPAFYQLIQWYRHIYHAFTPNESVIFFSCFKVLCLKCMYEYFPETSPATILKNVRIRCNFI